GGHGLATTARVALDGLRNVWRHFGVLAGEAVTRESLGLAPPVVVRATDDDNYLFAPDAGHWETLVDPGDRVSAGQLVGRVHFIDRPDREPSLIHAPREGVVCVVRAIAPCEPGDNVLVIGPQVQVSEPMGAFGPEPRGSTSRRRPGRPSRAGPRAGRSRRASRNRSSRRRSCSRTARPPPRSSPATSSSRASSSRPPCASVSRRSPAFHPRPCPSTRAPT